MRVRTEFGSAPPGWGLTNKTTKGVGMDALKPVVLAILILAAVGCDQLAGQATAAKDAVARFHEHLNGQRYDDIIGGATAGFRASAPRAERHAYFEGVRSSLGRHQDSDRVAYSADSGPSGSGVTVTLDSRFEFGSAQETFVFVERRDELVLHDYRINSRVFMIGRE